MISDLFRNSNCIQGFLEKYSFLSNSHPVKIKYEGVEYPSVEHAYQAAKTLNIRTKKHIAKLTTPLKAKEYGKKIKITTPKWDKEKTVVMLELLRLKFNQADLKKLLLATLNLKLVNFNYIGDTFWGQCNGSGSNKLGELIMKVRDELSSTR